LAASLLTWMFLNWLVPEGGVASAQDQPTPTPIAEETEEPIVTATATAVPSLQIRITAELAPDGDLDGDSVIDPGDTLNYVIRVANASNVPTGPIEVVFLYDAAFIGATTVLTEGGALDAGQVVWGVDQLGPSEERVFQLSAILNRRFPPGRTQVQASVVVRSGAAELARVGGTPVEVLGPNLRITDISTELVTDTGQTGRINPGDTVRFIIGYSNTGGGPSGEATLTADYPDELTKALVGNPDNAEDADGVLAWQLGSVPASSEVNTVRFTVTLADTFPPGVVSYDVPIALRSAAVVLDQRMASLAIAGPSLLITPRVEFVADGDGDGLVDPGDIIQTTLQVANVGSEPTSNIVVTVSYEVAVLEITAVEQEGVSDTQAGTLTWTLAGLEAGANQLLTYQGRVRALVAGQANLVMSVVTTSNEISLVRSEVVVAADAPTPTPEIGPTATPSVSETRPAQGQGILGPYAIAILIGAFLVISILAIVFVASRVLPSTTEEREAVDTPEERADHRRMVRELIEGVVLTAILFSVMILGLQNTLDKDSVNSIIAGIVGYVAGRVASSR